MNFYISFNEPGLKRNLELYIYIYIYICIYIYISIFVCVRACAHVIKIIIKHKHGHSAYLIQQENHFYGLRLQTKSLNITRVYQVSLEGVFCSMKDAQGEIFFPS